MGRQAERGPGGVVVEPRHGALTLASPERRHTNQVMRTVRRDFLRQGLALAAGAAALAAGFPALAFPETDVRRLSFANLHTGETLDAAYWEGGAYVPDALAAVNYLLRDFRTGEVHPIAPTLARPAGVPVRPDRRARALSGDLRLPLAGDQRHAARRERPGRGQEPAHGGQGDRHLRRGHGPRLFAPSRPQTSPPAASATIRSPASSTSTSGTSDSGAEPDLFLPPLYGEGQTAQPSGWGSADEAPHSR